MPSLSTKRTKKTKEPKNNALNEDFMRYKTQELINKRKRQNREARAPIRDCHYQVVEVSNEGDQPIPVEDECPYVMVDENPSARPSPPQKPAQKPQRLPKPNLKQQPQSQPENNECVYAELEKESLSVPQAPLPSKNASSPSSAQPSQTQQPQNGCREEKDDSGNVIYADIVGHVAQD